MILFRFEIARILIQIQCIRNTDLNITELKECEKIRKEILK